MASIPSLIPLFPLPDVVLFPRATLPLHIFEPRYRQTPSRTASTTSCCAADGPAVMVLNSDLPHGAFVDALSQSLPLGPLERQSLLDCDSVPERYARLLEVLDFRQIEQTYGRSRSQVVH